LKGHEFWNKWRTNNPLVIPELMEDLEGLDLSYYNLKDANLNNANLYGVNFSYANLEDTNLQGTYADNAKFIGTNLNLVQASGMQVTDADFRESSMREWISYDVKFHNSNLNGVDLRNSELAGCEFNNCNLENAKLDNCDLSHCNFSGTNLQNATLINSILVGCLFIGTNLENANLSYTNVYGTSIWNLKTNSKTIQKDLVITRVNEPIITLDNIKIAQFIYLLLKNEEIKSIIETVTSKAVLILGRFTPERKEKLEYIKDILRQKDLAPILFDFEKPSNKTTLETITTLASLCKFIVADISEPRSVPQELLSIVESMPALKVLPSIEKGLKPWGMYDHIAKYPWVLPIIEYSDNFDIRNKLIQQIDDM
jgi:uncharacterized protein YjbI with pentapeptide repeats